MMEVASNYMFRPLWWQSSGCTSKRKIILVQCAKNLYNFDIEISSILTVYVYIPDNQIVRVRGAAGCPEFLETSSTYLLRIVHIYSNASM
jgi:hypothetical protein